jgi:serine phosphatase RsbU (regulator of sigma subunit)
LIDRHNDLSNKHRSIERELEMAARVQRDLLPERLPQGDGFRFDAYFEPSTALGGDFYDAAERDDEAILLLADVSGHGAQAALTSMLLKASFHESARTAQGPCELLESMDRQLHKFLPTGMYACAATVWVRVEDARVRVANAGLPYPRLLTAADKRVDELPLTGMPLGMFGESMPGSHDLRELEMLSGDVLLLATDGLGDLQNPDGAMMQDGALEETLSALAGEDGEELLSRLVERAKEFAAGVSHPDDLSILALTRN